MQFRIAPGHYLYRDRLQLTDASGAPLQPELPPGDVYDDPEFGPVAVLRGDQNIHLDIPARPGATIGLRYQGCAQGRLCYAPVQRPPATARSAAMNLRHRLGIAAVLLLAMAAGMARAHLFAAGAGAAGGQRWRPWSRTSPCPT